MKKERLKLVELKVQSFITEMTSSRFIKAGKQGGFDGEDDSAFSDVCNSKTQSLPVKACREGTSLIEC